MAYPKFLILCAFLSVLSAQPHVRKPEPAQAHKRLPGPAPKFSDAEIQAHLQAKLAKSKIGKNGFKFTTNAGVTTIEGKANVLQHKGAATRMAKAAGARAVVNKIVVSEEAKQSARDKLTTGRRRAQVKRGDVRTAQR